MNALRKDPPLPDEIGQVLGTDGPQSTDRFRRPTLWVAGLIAAVLASVAFFALHGEPDVRYVTQDARRGDLSVSVTAAGTIRPTNQVDISSELSGTIRSVEVDFNDEVHPGQVLARLDTSRLESLVSQSGAAVESAGQAVSASFVPLTAAG